MFIPSARLCFFPLMWSSQLMESFTMHSHTEQKKLPRPPHAQNSDRGGETHSFTPHKTERERNEASARVKTRGGRMFHVLVPNIHSLMCTRCSAALVLVEGA
jgi:hypothetical protein